MPRLAFILIGIFTVTAASAARAAPVTVYLDRDGESRPAQEGAPAAEIPPFGGGDHAWAAIAECVRAQYAPFQVDIVETRPAHGPYITAVVGGLASQLGLDDRTTNGVGPYDGKLIPDAVVHVFSRVGTGERDIENVCAVTAHEVGHALGLDHEVYCGDIMSYYLDQCGARTFVDAEAPCGEETARACGNGAASQSSYQQLARTVGLRATPLPAADPLPVAEPEPAPDAEAEQDAAASADDDAPPPPRHHPRHRARRYQVQSRNWSRRTVF